MAALIASIAGTVRIAQADCGHGDCVTLRESTELYFHDDFLVDTGLGVRRVAGATLVTFPIRVGFAVHGVYAALELEMSGIPAGAPLLPVAGQPSRDGISQRPSSVGEAVRADTACAGYAIAGLGHTLGDAGIGDVGIAIESAAGLRFFSYSGSDPDVVGPMTPDLEARGRIELRTHEIYSIGIVVAKSVVAPADWAAGVQLGVRLGGGT